MKTTIIVIAALLLGLSTHAQVYNARQPASTTKSNMYYDTAHDKKLKRQERKMNQQVSPKKEVNKYSDSAR